MQKFCVNQVENVYLFNLMDFLFGEIACFFCERS